VRENRFFFEVLSPIGLTAHDVWTIRPPRDGRIVRVVLANGIAEKVNVRELRHNHFSMFASRDPVPGEFFRDATAPGFVPHGYRYNDEFAIRLERRPGKTLELADCHPFRDRDNVVRFAVGWIEVFEAT
jgi:hypothetical protein